MDCAIVFVGPRGVGEDAFDAGGDLGCGLGFADRCGQSVRDFVAALGEVFGDVVEDLGAVVGCGLAPACGFAGGFYGVADIFAIAEAGFSEELSVVAADFHAVAGVGTGLLAADIELDCAVD